MATLIKRLMSLVCPSANSEAEFYAGKNVTDVEWWISYASNYPELYWGRLRVFSDGTADASFDEANVYGFDDRKFAGYFLGEDEYTPFARLSPEDEQLIGAKAAQRSPPRWNDTPTHFEYLGIY